MSKKKTTYVVGGISTTSAKVARKAVADITREISNDFVNSVLSISQFAKYLHGSKSASCNFVKNSVLKLKKGATQPDVFNALKKAYPFVNASGVLVMESVFTKGVKTITPVTLFSEAFLNNIIECYLDNKTQITLPTYFKREKGVIVEIAENVANEIKERNESAKQSEKAKKESNLCLLGVLESTCRALVKERNEERRNELISILKSSLQNYDKQVGNESANGAEILSVPQSEKDNAKVERAKAREKAKEKKNAPDNANAKKATTPEAK